MLQLFVSKLYKKKKFLSEVSTKIEAEFLYIFEMLGIQEHLGFGGNAFISLQIGFFAVGIIELLDLKMKIESCSAFFLGMGFQISLIALISHNIFNETVNSGAKYLVYLILGWLVLMACLYVNQKVKKGINKNEVLKIFLFIVCFVAINITFDRVLYMMKMDITEFLIKAGKDYIIFQLSVTFIFYLIFKLTYRTDDLDHVPERGLLNFILRVEMYTLFYIFSSILGLEIVYYFYGVPLWVCKLTTDFYCLLASAMGFFVLLFNALAKISD